MFKGILGPYNLNAWCSLARSNGQKEKSWRWGISLYLSRLPDDDRIIPNPQRSYRQSWFTSTLSGGYKVKSSDEFHFRRLNIKGQILYRNNVWPSELKLVSAVVRTPGIISLFWSTPQAVIHIFQSKHISGSRVVIQHCLQKASPTPNLKINRLSFVATFALLDHLWIAICSFRTFATIIPS